MEYPVMQLRGATTRRTPPLIREIPLAVQYLLIPDRSGIGRP